MAMKRVTIPELGANLESLLREAAGGEELEVVDEGQSIARIVAANVSSRIIPARKPFASVRARTYPRFTGRSISASLLLEERRERSEPERSA